MPRVLPHIVRHARKIDSHLASLLPVCRDLRHAQNELRWMREHAAQTSISSAGTLASRLRDYVKRRAKGEPLQYILGTEFFGDLEIECRPGVLIPRQETAASVTRLATLLRKAWRKHGAPEQLSVLDLCTGSGCIPLLLHHELSSTRLRDDDPDHQQALPELRIVGVDISSKALELARFNAKSYSTTSPSVSKSGTLLITSQDIRFLQANVLSTPITNSIATASPLHEALQNSSISAKFDILISNPPYISSMSFLRTTSASVRRYEPKLALVPRPSKGDEAIEHDGDAFYKHLLQHAEDVEAKIVLFEVADLDQAERVAGLTVARGLWEGVEIWRDDPTPAEDDQPQVITFDQQDVRIIGSGHGRSVFAWRGVGAHWLNAT
ncbi:hypothetical protein LTR95_015044 [Oleoguttula sp. CCFEE 5521]